MTHTRPRRRSQRDRDVAAGEAPAYREAEGAGAVLPSPAVMSDRGECKFEGCDRGHFSGGYCSGHYKQHLGGGPLKPLRTARGSGTKVQVRMPLALRDAALEAARVEGVDEPEWWRRAGQERLARGNAKK